MKLAWICHALPLVLAACASHQVEPGFEDLVNSHGYSRGCSWYCGCPSVTVKATSADDAFEPGNLHDAEAETVWMASEAGRQTVTFRFDMTHEAYGADNELGIGVDWVSIINGDARSKGKWRASARAKTLKVRFNGKPMTTLTLADSMEPQRFELPRMLFLGNKVNELSFEVVDVHPGERLQRVAMADFYFSGFGQIH